MWTRLLLTLALAALPALAAGCGAQEGETVMKASPGSGENVGKAPYTGTYTLYTSMSPNPTVTVKLNEGEALGFRKTADDRIEAVYGDKSYPFNKGTAEVYWKVVK